MLPFVQFCNKNYFSSYKVIENFSEYADGLQCFKMPYLTGKASSKLLESAGKTFSGTFEGDIKERMSSDTIRHPLHV